MKLKALVCSLILTVTSLAFAQTDEQKAEVKASITEMITLIEQNNVKELVVKYANIPAEEKAAFVEMIETSDMPIPAEAFADMKAALENALQTEPTFLNEEFIFSSDNHDTMNFTKVGDVWQLKE